MIELPPIPPSNKRINKTQVSEKDPHHERGKKKRDEGKHEIEDEITLESITPAKKKDTPPTPLTGHIDIEA